MHLPTEQLWAIDPPALESMLRGLAAYRDRTPPTVPDRPLRRIAQAAIIDMTGPLEKSPTWLSRWYGGTSMQDVREELHQALSDSSVREIILRIDSPGGTVAGTDDLAADVAAANRVKPVTSFIEDRCCSAAYWIGSQAGRVYANRSATVGSIGTMAVVYDWSAALDRAGVKAHVFTSGRYKGAGVFGSALTDDHAESIQRLINAHTAAFQSDVARNRRLNPQQLDRVFNADVFVGPAAVNAGLVDRICRLCESEAQADAERQAAERQSRRISEAQAIRTRRDYAAINRIRDHY